MNTTSQSMQAVRITTSDDRLRLHAAQLAAETTLPMSDAVRVKAAEFWLMLGEADQALRELERLPKATWNNPFAVKARVAALGVLRAREETAQVTVQE